MNETDRRIKRTAPRRRKPQTNLWKVLPVIIVVLIAVLSFAHTSLNNRQSKADDIPGEQSPVTDTAKTEPDTTPLQEESAADTPPGIATGTNPADSRIIPEKNIYSFLQGPKAWKKKKPWSGSWGEKYMSIGLNFSSFACGHCCIANVYDTLSPYEISPVDAYKFARKRSIYYPSSASGAIGWEALSDCLDQMGVDCSLKRKPARYSTFQYRMDHCVAAVILLLSDDPDSFWGTVSGHYVTIWNYDSTDDTVFVANSGEYKKNRKTIPLRECYDYLKAVSPFQVLYIYGYDETFDTWKPKKGITEKWIPANPDL